MNSNIGVGIMICLSLTAIPTLGQSTNSSTTSATKKSVAPKATILTSEEQEAQKHYRIALEALKHDDFSTAADELTTASKLAPKNALIWYNLAVVESKKGDSAPALEHLQKAEGIRLPKNLTKDADELEAKLSYDIKRDAKTKALSVKLSELQTQLKENSQNNTCETGGAGEKMGEYSNYALNFATDPHRLTLSFTSGYRQSVTTGAFSQSSLSVRGEYAFDPADLDPTPRVKQESSWCDQQDYMVTFLTRSKGLVHTIGVRSEEGSGQWAKPRTDSPIQGDDDALQMIFHRRESADAVARTFSEVILLSSDK